MPDNGVPGSSRGLPLECRCLLLSALQCLGVFELLGHPDAAVVAQRLTHEGELGLEVPGLRNAGGVDLRVAGVGEVGALRCARQMAVALQPIALVDRKNTLP